MKRSYILIGGSLTTILLLTVLLLTGCGGAATTATVPAEEVPVVQTASGAVIAEAVIEPARWSELRFEIAGDVIEVLVQEGDAVVEGDVLARLDTLDLERAIAQAELNLNEAQVGLGQAQLRLAQIQEPPDEADILQAEHAVEQAAAAIQAAQLELKAVQNTVLLNEALEDAQKAYDDKKHVYEVRLGWYESGQEPEYWYVEHAKEELDDAKLHLDRIRQQADAQLQQARNAVTQAQHAHQEAQDALARLLEGPDPLDVEAVQKEIETAQLGVQAADLALDEATSALTNAELLAPFSGVIAKANVEPGDTANPAEAAFVLAMLGQLQAHTVDLTELDVARVFEGQSATVTVDALPDETFAGKVVKIALQPGDYRGDVVYAATVELTDVANSPLRWGMTALVEIDTD